MLENFASLAAEITVSAGDIQGLAPVLVSAGFGLLILMMDAFQRPTGSRSYLASFAVIGLLLTAGSAYVLWNQHVTLNLFSGMLYLDGFGQAFAVIFSVAGLLTCLIAAPYLEEHGNDRGEFYALILFAVTGMILVGAAGNLLMVFLGIETMSLSAYILAGFFRNRKQSAEASLKYLVLGALSTGLLLYGMALVYGATGTTDLAEIGRIFSGGALPSSADAAVTHLAAPGLDFRTATGMPTVVHQTTNSLSALPFIGMILIVVALSFKVALVPFHMWAPDVYEGTPTPAVGFMATAVKAAGFAAILRIFLVSFFGDAPRISETGWTQILVVFAFLSIVVGNFAALVQNKLKRMLAYSSIAHAGYIMIGVVATGYSGNQGLSSSVVFYLVAYTFGTIGAFGILTVFGRKREEVTTYEDLNGLGYKYPALAFAMALFMISAAGIPPTAGFFAKFLVFRAGVAAAGGGGPAPGLMMAFVSLGILASVAGVYYYLKAIVHLYMREPTREIRPLKNRGAGVALAICAVMTLALGLLPNRVTDLSHIAVTSGMADTKEGPDATDTVYRQVDNELSDNELSDNELSDNELSDNDRANDDAGSD